jgi:hypothetical protein
VSPEKRTQSPAKKKIPTQPPSKAQTATQAEELPDLHLPRAEHVRPPRKKYLDDRDTGIPWGLIATAALIVLLALFLWNRHTRNARAAASSAPIPAPLAPPVATTSTAPASNQSAAAQSNDAARSTSGTQPSSAVPSPTALRSTAAKPAAISTPAGATMNAVAPAEASPAASLVLTIRASENSWISVRADGQEVTQETLIAPAHTSVRATREIVVKTGNAAGINFVWNGKEVPAQGAEAEVKTVVFDATGVRTSTPTQPAAQNQ